ncbi:MAG TPA: phenylalanine--tRNA ligase subunit beta [Candidatus Saccharimonadales bacterium]|nr:phenylalanine--tRNA ligase subunit beta [Candidatus Saccharimonadales bacterium]
MKYPVEWLNEYLPKKLAAREMADAMELAGIEVEEISSHQLDDLIVIGKVKSVDPHPDADKLRIAVVDVKNSTSSIVCGAPNLEPGQTVAVAQAGAVMPDGMKITKTKIRGVESNGMICSEKELGLGDDHEGIMILPADLKAGSKASTILEGGEVIDATTAANRWDLNSLVGVVREIAAQVNQKMTFDAPAPIKSSKALKLGKVDGKLSGRYMLTRLSVEPGRQSPDWLVRRLRGAGVRPIGLVVDITNYVMLELGQPLHAFDASKTEGAIGVRLASKGEKLVTLDGKERSLHHADVVIADDKKALGLAGVMGAANSEVDDTTTEILLESATFNRAMIRQSALRHGLRSDASARFERGVPIDLQPIGLARATQLLQKYASGKIVAGPADFHSQKSTVTNISVRPERISRLLGFELSSSEIKKQLIKLDWVVKPSGSKLTVVAPWWRTEVKDEADVAEEVMKLEGYDKLPAKLPHWRPQEVQFDRFCAAKWQAKSVLRSLGWFETVTYSFISEKQLTDLGMKPESYLKLKNPMSSEQAYLRVSLLPSLLSATSVNRGYSREFGMFEFSKVYQKTADGKLPDEISVVAALVVAPNNGYRQVKSALDRLCYEFNVDVEVRPGAFHSKAAHPANSGMLYLNGQHAGVIGQLHPSAVSAQKLRGEVSFLELNWDKFLAAAKPKVYREISRFPSITRDLSVVVNRQVTWFEIEEALKDLAPQFIGDFYGKDLPEGKKVMTVRLEFSDLSRTLTDDEADAAASKALEILKNKFSAQLR